MVVLRNLGKPDYTIAKEYRTIALFNTLGKSLEFIPAKKNHILSQKL